MCLLDMMKPSGFASGFKKTVGYQGEGSPNEVWGIQSQFVGNGCGGRFFLVGLSTR